MSDWGFWEWVAYAVLFVAALILAMDQGLKMAPDLASAAKGLLGSPAWAFSPLILVLLATGILFSRQMGWIGSSKMEIAFVKWPEPYRPTIVSGRVFSNERVPLDGIDYDHCVFTNVTLVYNGTTPVRMSNNTFNGTIRLSSDNQAVGGGFMLAYSFAGGGVPIQLDSLPPSSHITPLQPKH
ncbi:MAG TPA: hypothetical protein VFA80_10515 [Xanthobacteraceae bacterium]|nr:hypothetical protein [Xanthobacteraceae bacterium]